MAKQLRATLPSSPHRRVAMTSPAGCESENGARVRVCVRAFPNVATSSLPPREHALHYDFAAPPVKRRSLSSLPEPGLPLAPLLAHASGADLKGLCFRARPAAAVGGLLPRCEHTGASPPEEEGPVQRGAPGARAVLGGLTSPLHGRQPQPIHQQTTEAE